MRGLQKHKEMGYAKRQDRGEQFMKIKNHRKRREKRKKVAILALVVVAFVISLTLWENQQNKAREAAKKAEETKEKSKKDKSDKEDTFDREKLAAAGCPDTLLDLAERNPETVDFVKGYLDYDSASVNRDISAEVQQGTIPLFLQWDMRWGYEQYGDNFMAVTGCGPTCLSMVYCGLTGNTDMNPYEVAKKADAEGYYVDGEGSLWTIMETFADEMGLQEESIMLDENTIRTNLTAGKPIICVVGPGEFTDNGHFMVLTGISQDGKILLHDPNSKANSNKEWDYEELASQIEALWAYSVG